MEFVKIAYWAPKEQKYQLSSKKGPQGGPKSENQLYLNNYDSVRHKNWQMLRTNWYNNIKILLGAKEFARIANWAPKEQKRAPKGVQNQKISYISTIMIL